MCAGMHVEAVSGPGPGPSVTAVITTDHMHLLGRRRPVGNDFLDVTPEALVTKQQIGNLGYFRIKNMYVSKDPTNRMKT